MSILKLGFRAQMSTIDNAFVLNGLTDHIKTGIQLHCASMDFSKAFDYVCRDTLWFKLIDLVLNNKRSMYNNLKWNIYYMNSFSNNFECKLGVRQGKCLSPLLFLLFLDDIEEMYMSEGLDGIDVDMFKMLLILYTDDIVLFANNKQKLQLSLDRLYE